MIRGRDFLTVVDHLRAKDGEIYKRTSFSRAYYAAFLEARGFSNDYLGHAQTRSANEHQRVPTVLHELDPGLAANMRFLRRLQNNADYDINLSSDTIARSAVDAEDFATRIIARLDELAAQRTTSES
ncbi:MAG: hypothetical protein WBA63_16855 [Thermomicrobiales bacterium]